MTTSNRPETSRRIGELASATGLTVRTLHYYEEIGLLVASERSEAGHRLYADGEVEQGAVIDYEPVDQPYGYREYSARDSEGALWSFMKPLD